MPLSSYTATDILLTERRRLEKPLFLLIWVGTASFSLAEENYFYLISCTLAVAVNWLAARQNKEVYVRKRFVNIGVTVALIIILLEHYKSDQMLIITIGHFMVLIQLLKLFERKRSRDYVQLLVLSMLLVVSSAMTRPSMWFVAVFVLYVLYLILACYVVMIFTLKRGLDTAAKVTLRSEAGPLSPRQVAWNVVRDWPGKAIRRMVPRILVPSLLIATLAFLIVPRAENYMMATSGRYFSSAGLAPSIRLGEPRELYLSDRMIMRVQVNRDDRRREGFNKESRYLRKYVMNDYASSTWKNSDGPKRFSLSPNELPPLDSDTRKKMVSHRIDMMSLGRPDIVAPYPTVLLQPPSGATANLSRDLEYDLGGSFRLRDRVRYNTWSFPRPLTKKQLEYLRRIRGQPVNMKYIIRRTQLPPHAEQRIRDLAKLWCKDLLQQRRDNPDRREELNLAIAHRIKNKLQAEYGYTLDLSESDPSRDGVEDFLFYLQRGHCEYFASSLAVMCRLLGVPARVATGFLMDEYDADAGEFIVRQRDAHAWCEVYSSDTDWTIIDATSTSDRLGAMKRSWLSGFTDLLQEMRFFWYRKVVGYDSITQRNIGKMIADRTGDVWRKVCDVSASLKQSFIRLLTRGVVDRILINFLLLLQAIMAAILLLSVLGWIRRRRRHPVPDQQRRLVLLDRFLAMLERRGLVYQPWETLRERAVQAEKRFSLPADRLGEMTELQYRWRWGGEEPSEEELRRTRENFEILCEILNTPRSNS